MSLILLKIYFSTQVPQDVRSLGMANITGIVLPYFRLCLLIVHSAAPDLNSTNEGPIAPITPFPSGEETIWPAYKLSDMDGKAGPERTEIIILMKIFWIYIFHNVQKLNNNLCFDFKEVHKYLGKDLKKYHLKSVIIWVRFYKWFAKIECKQPTTKFLPDSHWFEFDGSSISTEFVGPASPKPPATTIFTAPESW